MTNPGTSPAAELFDLTDDQLRARASVKWSSMDRDVLPAWVAEMDVKLADSIVATLQAALDRHDAGYPAAPDGVVEAFAGFARDRWHWHIDPEHVSIHVDVATAGAQLMRHYAGSDGRVLLMTPVYNGFYHWLSGSGLTPVEVPLVDIDDGGFFDLAAIEDQLAAGVKVVLLCNPHNPLGRVFSDTELQELAVLAQRYNAVVLSDEIHAPLVFDGVEFTPWLMVSEEARNTGIALHAATKSWNVAGLKCGIAVRSAHGPWPADLDPATTLIGAGFWGMLATEAAFAHGRDWLDLVRDHFQSQSRLLSTLVAQHLPGVRVSHPRASFLAWLDFRDTDLDEEPADYFLREARIALSSGVSFGTTAGQGCARLNMGTSAERLERIIAAMRAAWPPR